MLGEFFTQQAFAHCVYPLCGVVQPPSGPPHVWLSAPVSDRPKTARAAQNRFDGLATPHLPLTQDELEISRMFDLTAYHHAGEEEEKLCAEQVFKQYLVRLTQAERS